MENTMLIVNKLTEISNKLDKVYEALTNSNNSTYTINLSDMKTSNFEEIIDSIKNYQDQVK